MQKCFTEWEIKCEETIRIYFFFYSKNHKGAEGLQKWKVFVNNKTYFLMEKWEAKGKLSVWFLLELKTDLGICESS